MKPRGISQSGLAGIARFEGFRAKAYRCPAGVPTIGYGATHYLGGLPVCLEDPPICEADARALLKAQLHPYEQAVTRYVLKALNQNQFDALVSFAYNVGIANLKASTLLRLVNQDPDQKPIADEFKRWVYAAGHRLKGLEHRRSREAQLYFTPCD